MDEQAKTPSDRSVWYRSDWPWLLTLLVLVGLLRVWLLAHTEVTARDSIGFIHYALQFDDRPWTEVLRGNHQHPGYPAAIWLVSQPLRALRGTTPETMQLAAQLVNVGVSLLLAFVMYRLGKHLWDRAIGFWAALIFQFLPGSGHLLSDGISDPLSLLCGATALYFLAIGLESGRLRDFAIGGAFIGLAYLTRPEGLLILPATWIALVGLRLARTSDQAWAACFRSGIAMTATCALSVVLYVHATGAITNKIAPGKIFDDIKAAAEPVGGSTLLFATTFQPASNKAVALGQSLRGLGMECMQAYNYVAGFIVLWALLACARRVAHRPGAWVLAIHAVLHAVVLVRLGMSAGYISERHVLPIVMLGCYPCVIGAMHLCSPAIRMFRADAAAPSGFLFPIILQRAAACWLIVGLGVCLVRTAQPLHFNRAGNHQAGLWLAKNVQPGDLIDDDLKWSHFYSGKLLRNEVEAVPADRVPTYYKVMTRRGEPTRINRDIGERNIGPANARPVYHWPESADPATARVVIYAKPRDPRTHPWNKDRPVDALPVSRP